VPPTPAQVVLTGMNSGCYETGNKNLQISCNRTLNPLNPVVNGQPLMGITKTPSLFCGVPRVDSAGEYGGVNGWAQWNTCLQERCNDPYPAFQGSTDVDMQFNTKPCTPYTTQSGIQSSWCFDPAVDPPPAEQSQQCGDHWNKPTELDTNWRLYTVPFTSMGQQGFAKRSDQLDLSAVSVFRFTWDGGWVDFYVDNVRFYRHKTATQ
jgi:hypothetical protein